MVGPKTADDLRAVIAALPVMDMPSIDRIENMIGRLSLATKERQIPAEAQKERISLYWRVLRDIPIVDLAAGFDKLLASCTFMPTPAEVRAACAGFKARREYRLSRAKHLVWLHDREWRNLTPLADMADPAEVAALLAAVQPGSARA